jgi:hypothetical protein
VRVVVDIGSASYGGDQSVIPLIEEFQPDRLLGFDPNTEARDYLVGDTEVSEKRLAAWTSDKPLTYRRAGLGGWIDPTGPIQCVGFNLAALLLSFDAEDELILKLDCEGAEYPLVPHLIATGAAARLRLALIEWHCSVCRHGIIDQSDPPVHPGGCSANPVRWAKDRAKLEARLAKHCEVGRWNR